MDYIILRAMSGCPSGKSVILDMSIIRVNICLSKNYTVKLGEIDRGHISKTQGCDINTSDLTTVPVSLVFTLLARMKL
jgi:hypothetical protein